MLKCYYDVLDQGVAFMSSYRTFVFSTDPHTLVSRGDGYRLISDILKSINCEKIMTNYHEMMLGEKYIVDTLKDNGFVVEKVENLGGCRNEDDCAA